MIENLIKLYDASFNLRYSLGEIKKWKILHTPTHIFSISPLKTKFFSSYFSTLKIYESDKKLPRRVCCWKQEGEWSIVQYKKWQTWWTVAVKWKNNNKKISWKEHKHLAVFFRLLYTHSFMHIKNNNNKKVFLTFKYFMIWNSLNKSFLAPHSFIHSLHDWGRGEISKWNDWKWVSE